MLSAATIPSGKGIVAVFSNPWGRPAIEVIARAGGPIVSGTQGSWVALTEADGDQFIDRLYRSGAGFVASALVARACAGLSGLSLETPS